MINITYNIIFVYILLYITNLSVSLDSMKESRTCSLFSPYETTIPNSP